jgi:hypothetical protein
LNSMSSSLADILNGRHLPEGGEDNQGIKYCLNSGAQEVLLLLMVAAIGRMESGNRVPAGMSALIMNNLDRPALGGLQSFFVKSHQEGLFGEDAALAEQGELEKRGKGLLGQLVRLRNELEHPKELSREQILDQGSALLQEIPPFFTSCKVHFPGDGATPFLEAGSNHDLAPMILRSSRGTITCAEFQPGTGFHFPENAVALAPEWKEIWDRLRDRDPALTEPTWPEIVRRITPDSRPRQIPWWSGKAGLGKESGMLIEPCEAAETIWELESAGPALATIDLQLGDGITIPEALAKSLRLKHPLTAQQLSSLLAEGDVCRICADARGLEDRDILQHLYWAADLHELEAAGKLMVFLTITAEQLDQVWESHWDRLPDQLDQIFRKSPGGGKTDLARVFWPRKKPRRGLWPF